MIYIIPPLVENLFCKSSLQSANMGLLILPGLPLIPLYPYPIIEQFFIPKNTKSFKQSFKPFCLLPSTSTNIKIHIFWICTKVSQCQKLDRSTCLVLTEKIRTMPTLSNPLPKKSNFVANYHCASSREPSRESPSDIVVQPTVFGSPTSKSQLKSAFEGFLF